jgi:hypothetical protein
MQLNLDSWNRELKRIHYPAQMQMVDRGISGLGYYPGARQCLFGAPSAPRVMILGRDFGTKAYYDRLASQPERSENSLTWRHTHGMYLARLSEMRVFCTNYLMGIRMDGSALGDVSERISKEDWLLYESSCWSFLSFQIEQFNPHVLLVCGKDNRRDLDREGRLKFFGVDVVYGQHPHSAIGARNRVRHLDTLKMVCHRVKLAIS